MTDTFLSPLGDLEPIFTACRVPASDRFRSEVIQAAELAAMTAASLVVDGYREGDTSFAGCGPIAPTEMTQRVKAGATVVALSFPPASVDSFAADDGSTVSVADVTIDGCIVTFDTPLPAGVLTYTAGFAETPAWATAAGLIIAEHYYRTRLGATRVDTTPGAGAAFLVPKAAQALLAPHERTPLGFA